MARDKGKTTGSDPDAKAGGRKRKKAEDTGADAKDEPAAEPAPDTTASPDPGEAKRAKKGDDATETEEDGNDTEPEETEGEDVKKESGPGDDKPVEKGTPEKGKKGKAKPKSAGAKKDAKDVKEPTIDAPIVKVPSSIEKLGQLKTQLEDGMKEIEDGRAAVEAGATELAELEVRAMEIRQKMSQQEGHNNRASRRLKQVTKSLQEQAVSTEMLQQTLVTLVVRKCAKSKDPSFAEVAQTCVAILADWKQVVAQNLQTENATAPVEAQAVVDPEKAADEAKQEEVKSDASTPMDTGDHTVKSEDADEKKEDIPLIVPGKTAPHDPTRAKVVGWLAQRIGLPQARLLESEIFASAGEAGDMYKRCFKLASDLVSRGNVPEGYVRKIVSSWEK